LKRRGVLFRADIRERADVKFEIKRVAGRVVAFDCAAEDIGAGTRIVDER
jgi:hypothetical protein